MLGHHGEDMLRAFRFQDNRLVADDIDPSHEPDANVAPVWLDLMSPTPDEDRFVERLTGISIPTREEMQEIEFSSRLFSESGAEYMTVVAAVQLDTDQPMLTPITFALKGNNLVTVRHADPKSFPLFIGRVQKPGTIACQTGELIMLGILEAMVDRAADALERVGVEIDGISHEVFQSKAAKASVRSQNLRSIILQIGRKGELLGIMREALVSFYRMLTYHSASEGEEKKGRQLARARLKTLHRDISSLSDHADSLTSKINFLLDATLGLINLEQNQIIKIFSVAAVVFLPPTLVASIYGMNFHHMPELGLRFGYPVALLLMAVSAVVPYLFFKRRGWL